MKGILKNFSLEGQKTVNESQEKIVSGEIQGLKSQNVQTGTSLYTLTHNIKLHRVIIMWEIMWVYLRLLSRPSVMLHNCPR